MTRIYSIKEVSNMFSINANKLRFYEKKGLIMPNRNSVSGYREFDKDDLLNIQLILTYRSFDIPIQDIKSILDKSSNITLEQQLFKQLKLVNNHIKKYKVIQSGLEKIMNEYLLDTSPNSIQNNFIKLGESISYNDYYLSSWKDIWNFDSISESYDEFVIKGDDKAVFYTNYDQLLDCVYKKSIYNLDQSSSILDIGVGTGNLSIKYLEDAFNIVGMDQSIKMMIKAKEKAPKLKLKYGSLTNLPFPNSSFDRIVSTFTFHHLDQNEKVISLKEMLRVIKANGEIYIGDIMSETSNIPVEIRDTNEHYTVIQSFSEILKLENLIFEIIKIDQFLFVLKIKKTLEY